MNLVQSQAIEEVRKLMIANFDSYLLTYRETNEKMQSKIGHDWHGDVAGVVGLAAITNSRMLQYSSLKGVE